MERVEVYCDAVNAWRFRRMAANGEITATSEGYTRRHDAVRAAQENFPLLSIEVEPREGED